MMTPLTVIYLHTPTPNDKQILQTMEYGLSDAFRNVCREMFSVGERLDYPTLRLVAVDSPSAMDSLLFHVDNERHFLSDYAKSCCLFLLDDELRRNVDGKNSKTESVSLDELRQDGLSIQHWFRVYFPAIPKVVLTRPGHKRISLPARRWVQKEFEVLTNPEIYRERIEHMFKSFWMPRFWAALHQYAMERAGTNWHTPGHNGGNAFERSPFLHGFHDAFEPLISRTDLSVSVESLGDLSTPEAHTPLSEAQRVSSEIFGTAQTRFVTNGTSTSNKAMLMTLLRPGETVLLDRNCHKSVHHAVVMSGAVPRYLPARFNTRLGIWGPIALKDLQKEITRPCDPAQKPKLLIITTCTYEGVLYPVWEIGKMCEREGILFYADEAWAPYLNFHPYYTIALPDNQQVRYNAVNDLSGAHFAVQSTHKALSAFSQASMIHVSLLFKKLLEDDGNPKFRWLRKRFSLHGHGSYEKFSHDLHEVLRYWHSTSPHYPTLATLDIAGVQMRLEGLKLIEERLHWVAAFKKRVAEICELPQEECFVDLDAITGDGKKWEAQGYLHDPLKMTLSFKNEHLCDKFEKLLLKNHIQWEKSTPVTILFLVTVGTVEEHFEYLFRTCLQMKDAIGRPETDIFDPHIVDAVNCQAAVLPRDAALCDGELIPLEETEGRICSQLLVPYPPGIPVFIPGLAISRPMIDLIRNVIDKEGTGAIHGLFVRGKKIYVEVLNRDEEHRVQWLI
ncbi:MAG: aminotransferase class I/II-fold pyridoxal phosphate-dependent enzyme [Kiritimatiellae bacterium]|nr:aminotransferase class I/II-fold pyridoxal phosphate-dependent enzyme [Kiritimatiellia bacterium]